MQRAYLDGLEQDGTLSWDHGEDGFPEGFEPAVRTDVDAGTGVIDLASMRSELEADRARKQGR